MLLYFEADDITELDETEVFLCSEQDDSWEVNQDLKLVLVRQLPAEDASNENDEVPAKRRSRSFDESRAANVRRINDRDLEEADSDSAASLVDIYGRVYDEADDDV